LPVTKLLDSSLAGSFRTTKNIITKRTCEAADRASLNNLKPAVMRMRWSRCYGQASRLLRLNIIHAT